MDSRSYGFSFVYTIPFEFFSNAKARRILTVCFIFFAKYMFTSFQSGRCPMSLSEQYYWHHSPYKIQVHCSKEAQASICCRQALGKYLLTFPARSAFL